MLIKTRQNENNKNGEKGKQEEKEASYILIISQGG